MQRFIQLDVGRDSDDVTNTLQFFEKYDFLKIELFHFVTLGDCSEAKSQIILSDVNTLVKIMIDRNEISKIRKSC